METILVTGGTGNIGRAFVSALAHDARGPIVRVASRDFNAPIAKLLRAMNPERVQPVAFDPGDERSVRAAFEGVTGAFVIVPFVQNMDTWHVPIARAAAASGTCRYVVKASVTGATPPDPGVSPEQHSIPARHWSGEEALRKSGVPTTAIRPTMYMQHFLDVPALYQPGGDKVYLPTGDGRVAFVDCRDIATFAAALLMAPPEARKEHDGAAYELTGPEALTGQQCAEILGYAAERTIAHVADEASFSRHAAELGVPDGVKFIYREAAEGWFAKVDHAAFTRVTGRRPTSFARFALDHAERFRGPRGR